MQHGPSWQDLGETLASRYRAPRVEATWHIRLCGKVAVERDGQDIGGLLPGRQGRALFAYLLLHRDRGCPRRELLEAVWGDDPPAAADGALSALLSKLRKVLGPGALQGRSEVRLGIGDEVWIDVESAATEVVASEGAAGRGDWPTAAAHARACLEIDCTSFLPDGDGDWVWDRRRELETMRVRALEVLAGACVHLSDLGAAEQAARAAVGEAPFRESAYRRLMEVHEAAGNPAEALRVFEELRKRLREDLGTSPGPASIALHDRLLRNEPAPADPGFVATVDAAPPLPPALRAVRERGHFVGRKEELEALGELWTGALHGRRRLVLLAGDAGVGKTGLAAELAARVHGGGAAVLYGRCDAEAVGPYQPVAEMLRTAGAAIPLAELVDPDRSGPEALRADLDTRRLRFFDAVAGLFAELGADRPLLVVLDDLHWADRPTLQLVRHLVRSTEPERVLFAGTFRDSEIEDDHPLPEFAGDLRREGVLERLAVAGLDRPEVAQLVRALTGEAPEPFVAGLHGETEGNPFFIEEVVRHLRETGAGLDLARAGVPDGVREITARRLRRLGESARRALQTASVVGREFDFEVLEQVGPVHGETLEAALEEAVAAHVVREDAAHVGRYAFAHALIRAVLYDSVSALRRARLHGRVGEALVDRDGSSLNGDLSAVAHHFARAAGVEDPARALDYSLRAAREADGVLAWEDAAVHYRAALRAHAMTHQLAPEEDRIRCDLLLALGASEERAGLPTARDTQRDALACARALADPPLLAQAALAFAGKWTVLGETRPEVVEALEEALAALGEEEAVLRARLLARMAFELYYVGDPARRLEFSEAAVALARSTGDLATLAACLDARHYALWRPETVDERIAVAGELCRIADAIGDRELALEGAGWMVVDHLEVGDVEAVDRQIEAAAQLAEAEGQPLYLWWTSLFRAMRAQLAGDFDVAERLALETLEMGRRGQAQNAVHYFAQQLFLTRRVQGRLEEVEEGVRGFIALYPAIPAWRGVLALLLLETGRAEDARAAFEGCLAGGVDALPRDANWLIAVTLLAEVCGGLGDEVRAAELHRELLPYAGRNVVVGRGASCNGSASRLLGILAATVGDRTAAEAHFADAHEMHRRMGARTWTAYTLVAEAEALLRLGEDPADDDRARGLLADAVGLCDQLGMPALRERARGLVAA